MTDDEVIKSAREWLLEQLDAGWVPGVGGFAMCGNACSTQHLFTKHPVSEVRDAVFGQVYRPEVFRWSNDLMMANDGERWMMPNNGDLESDIVTRVRRFLEQGHGSV